MRSNYDGSRWRTAYQPGGARSEPRKLPTGTFGTRATWTHTGEPRTTKGILVGWRPQSKPPCATDRVIQDQGQWTYSHARISRVALLSRVTGPNPTQGIFDPATCCCYTRKRDNTRSGCDDVQNTFEPRVIGSHQTPTGLAPTRP